VKARDAFIGFCFAAAEVGGEHGPPCTSEPPEYSIFAPSLPITDSDSAILAALSVNNLTGYRQDVQGLVTALLGSSLVCPKPPMQPLQWLSPSVFFTTIKHTTNGNKRTGRSHGVFHSPRKHGNGSAYALLTG
jgi:hypothetical protein